MVFNSFAFFAFLAVVGVGYAWLIRDPGRVVARNVFLLVASYFFYAWWDWRFLGLILLSTGIDYALSRAMARTDDDIRRRRLIWTSVAMNLGLLGGFKYFGFFVDSAAALLEGLGLEANLPMLRLVLPVGISFYTFQGLSYTIDVYRRRLQPSETILDFALFVAFFPQLVAGPIERATDLLPQLARHIVPTRTQLTEGAYLIVWGMFKKVAVADPLASVVDPVFLAPGGWRGGGFSGLDVWIAVYAFAVQIYCDFSGYTDIARGVAKLLGFELSLNFNLPYFAWNPSDFWRRWHISLSSWLREYLYISLGGNRDGVGKTRRNLMITMLLGGLWHGARWNFVIWGAWHGTILVVWHWIEERLGRSFRLPPAGAVVATLVMLQFTMIGWLLFRAESAAQIVDLGGRMFTDLGVTGHTALMLGALAHRAAFPAIVQLFQWFHQDLMVFVRAPAFVRLAFLLFCVLETIAVFGGVAPQFIYFQF